MKINNILYLSIITLLLLSIIPYTLSACTKVPVADDATKEKAQEEKDKAKEELEKAQQKLEDLESIQQMHWLIIYMTGHENDGTPGAFAEDIVTATGVSDRGDGIRDAQKKVDDAQEAYDTALENWESVQDEEIHPRYIPACGDPSHGITMCDDYGMQRYTNQYWKNWHEVRQASCSDYIVIDGINYYCTVSNFFLCQFHTHIYDVPYSSSSN